jgi:hypothetical protein
MPENLIKWTLFSFMATTVPVFYYMFVVGGFVPLIAIVAMTVFDIGGVFNVVHILIYGALFYWIAKAVSGRLARLSRIGRITGVACISAALLGVAFLPVYSLGHHESQTVNLYQLFHGNYLR